ncbi:unnamed protein product [Nezara viridula]|uniref:Uncharacterized protein n=1 Tax=Nezara viridula TaxID=85310 RepID=A0A9P0E7A5_NEZVI|nr:unnamed protein product [Nezara viridula]
MKRYVRALTNSAATSSQLRLFLDPSHFCVSCHPGRRHSLSSSGNINQLYRFIGGMPPPRSPADLELLRQWAAPADSVLISSQSCLDICRALVISAPAPPPCYRSLRSPARQAPS